MHKTALANGRAKPQSGFAKKFFSLPFLSRKGRNKITIQNPRCLAEFAVAARNKIKSFLAAPYPGGIAIPQARPTGENSARAANVLLAKRPCDCQSIPLR